ncbi:MAG: hypothetical protein IKJ19_03110 [Clostridia bacterium]|nr:hypothetical protein [Clostridia bacterium]
MRLKNAFKILISNSGVVYKAIVLRLLTISVIALISYFVVSPLLKPVFTCDDFQQGWTAIVESLRTLFKDFVSLADTNASAKALKESFDQLINHFITEKDALIKAFIGAGLFIFLVNLVERVGNYAIAFLYDGYMSALTKFSIVATLLANLGKAFLYSIITVPIVMIVDSIVFALAGLIVFYGLQVISIFAIILAVIFVILGLSFKLTLISRFLPNIIVAKKSIGRAFIDTFTNRKHLNKLLGSYVFMLMISFYLNVSVAAFTLGVGLFVSLPLCGNMNILIALVDYYNEHGKKYYTSSDNVVTPKELRENADLLKYM